MEAATEYSTLAHAQHYWYLRIFADWRNLRIFRERERERRMKRKKGDILPTKQT